MPRLFKRRKNRRSGRRKFGRDRRSPLPPVSEPASSLAIGRGRIAILVTVCAWGAYTGPLIWNELTRDGGLAPGSLIETLAYLVLTTLLALSATNYLLARHGALVRSQRHRRAPRGLIDAAMREKGDRSITVLIPSYREEARVIRQTILSAALQEYPHKRVVLLIDDPPRPDSRRAAQLLQEARDLPGEIELLMAGPGLDFREALTAFLADPRLDAEAVAACAADYHKAAGVLQDLRNGYPVTDGADRFTRDEVLGTLHRDLEATAKALDDAAEAGTAFDHDRMLQLRQRLAWTFNCEITSFERKRFANLSHEANKAMNLNSYIGLMGGNYRTQGEGERLALGECEPDEATVVIPDSDYILTLDADSVLLPEYCLRLTHRMEQPAFADVAVIQTPYSAFPGAGSRMERLAGATTDVQHILHQGMTYFDATFWVGANAILRRAALEDIAEVDTSGPWPVRRYVSDRTVIEDTESSMDLVAKGWRLHNYQERLSYSATPPDFGSLAIQRERWANGGLLILPKLWPAIRRGSDPIGALLRLNYMASIAWASFGLLVLLVWPFDDRLLSPLVVAMAVPYFAAMSSDLKRCGYKRTDVIRIYAFNLLMLPVNLTGVVKSLYQAASGRKYSFARTPKVKTRTTAAFGYAFFPYLLIAWSAWITYQDIRTEAWAHAVFAGTNALLGLYGLVAFVGIRHSIVDMWIRGVELLRTDTSRPSDALDAPEHWESVLFYGNDGSRQGAVLRMPPQLALTRPEHFAPPEEQGAALSPPRSIPSSADGARDQPAVDGDELLQAVAASKAVLEALERRLESAKAGTGPGPGTNDETLGDER